ncbi:MAG: hypothetical protein Q9182_001954 [Xanthomendoza sp. 2 TL-2023]
MVFSAALPSPQQPDPNSLTKNLTDVDSLQGADGLQCLRPPPWQYTVLPQQKNCAAAMRDLPDLPDIAEFHSQPGRDPAYQLPTFRRYKDCEVLIELSPGRTSRTSWLAIGLAATQLNLGCVDIVNPGNAGGVTSTGGPSGKDIKVSIRPVPGKKAETPATSKF